MKSTLLLRAAAAVILAGSAGLLLSQPGRPAVKASLKMDKSTAPVNSEVKGTVTVAIPAGWHAYQNPPSKDYQIPLSVEAADKSTKLTKAAYPSGTEEEAAGERSMVYNGQVKVPVTFKLGAKTGTQTLKVKVSYQLCDAGSCLPPASQTVTARITATRKS